MDNNKTNSTSAKKIIYAKGRKINKHYKSKLIKSILLTTTIILILALGILKVNNSIVKAQGIQLNSTNTNTLNNPLKASEPTINSNKHHVEEVITVVVNSIYDPLTNKYLNSCKTEDDEIYNFYSNKPLLDTWQVLIIDTKGNKDLSDDEVINSYNLDDYQFSNDN